MANAIKLAVNFHHLQFDKGGEPYIFHPLRIAHYTKSKNEEIRAIAILHDILEDTKATEKDLREDG